MRFIVFLILTSLLLGGCGAKGPLYLPESRYPQPATAPAPAPAVPATEEATPGETTPVEEPQESK
ncbi:MAG: hypothetical protein D4R48_03555 [Nitrosomonadales bacterium]|nr:MAG: hypothetical protein D4R48_03555 [Nitrosomonadales bacterium]